MKPGLPYRRLWLLVAERPRERLCCLDPWSRRKLGYWVRRRWADSQVVMMEWPVLMAEAYWRRKVRLVEAQLMGCLSFAPGIAVRRLL